MRFLPQGTVHQGYPKSYWTTGRIMNAAIIEINLKLKKECSIISFLEIVYVFMFYCIGKKKVFLFVLY